MLTRNDAEQAYAARNAFTCVSLQIQHKEFE